MTAAEGRPAPPVAGRAADRRADARAGRRADPELGALPSLCPYLATPDGDLAQRDAPSASTAAWRSPARAAGRREAASAVPRRRAYVGCATYGAAEAARARWPVRHAGQTRPVARMTPVILDHGRFDLRMPAFQRGSDAPARPSWSGCSGWPWPRSSSRARRLTGACRHERSRIGVARRERCAAAPTSPRRFAQRIDRARPIRPTDPANAPRRRRSPSAHARPRHGEPQRDAQPTVRCDVQGQERRHADRRSRRGSARRSASSST